MGGRRNGTWEFYQWRAASGDENPQVIGDWNDNIPRSEGNELTTRRTTSGQKVGNMSTWQCQVEGGRDRGPCWHRMWGPIMQKLWIKPWPKTEFKLPRPQQPAGKRISMCRRCWQAVVTYSTLWLGDSQYITLIHLELFTTRIKQGPCVPNRLAD